MVSAAQVPITAATSKATGTFGFSQALDRSITPSASYLASSGIRSARLLIRQLPVPD